MGCQEEQGVLVPRGPGQNWLLLPVLSRLSLFLLWSTSTMPTR